MRLLALFIFLIAAATCFAASDLELKNGTIAFDPNGETLHLQLTITNRGPESVERTHCRLTFYTGQQPTDSQVYSLQPLNSGGSREETLEWKISSKDVNAVSVEVYDELQPDEFPVNNSLKLPLRFPGQNKTDLQIVDVTFPETEKLDGKTAEFRVSVRNNGPLEVKASSLRINLVQFQQPVAFAEKKLGGLEPGDDKETKVVLRLPLEGIAMEQVLFEARCEIRDPAVEESDATNNIFSKPMLLSVRIPDLIVRDMRIDNRGNFAFWVVNKGTARSLPSVTALYVNGALVRRYSTPELAPTKSRRHIYGAVKLPAGTQVAVVADFNADLAESSEENNRLNFTVPAR